VGCTGRLIGAGHLGVQRTENHALTLPVCSEQTNKILRILCLNPTNMFENPQLENTDSIRGFGGCTNAAVFLGTQLRTLRRARGLSVKELAKLVGLAKGTIHCMERGDSSSVLSVARVVHALDRAEWLNELAPEAALPVFGPPPLEEGLRGLGSQVQFLRERQYGSVPEFLAELAKEQKPRGRAALAALESTGNCDTAMLLACVTALGRADWLKRLCTEGLPSMPGGPQRVGWRRQRALPQKVNEPLESDAVAQRLLIAFGERVRRMRLAKNQRLTDFSSLVCVNAVQTVEAGGNASVKTVTAIAQFLGCDEWLRQLSGSTGDRTLETLDAEAQAERLGAELKQLRIKRQLSQSELAEAAGTYRAVVQSAEQGNARLFPFVKFLHVLGRSEWLSEFPAMDPLTTNTRRASRPRLDGWTPAKIEERVRLLREAPSVEQLLGMLASRVEAALHERGRKLKPAVMTSLRLGKTHLQRTLELLVSLREEKHLPGLTPDFPEIVGPRLAAALGLQIRSVSLGQGLSAATVAKITGHAHESSVLILGHRGLGSLKSAVTVLQALGRAEWLTELVPAGDVKPVSSALVGIPHPARQLAAGLAQEATRV